MALERKPSDSQSSYLWPLDIVLAHRIKMGCAESITELSSCSSKTKKDTQPAATQFLIKFERVSLLPEISAAMEQCEVSHTHSRLLDCIGIQKPVKRFKPVPKWACRPQTVGCVALSLLNWLIKRKMLRIPESELQVKIECFLGDFTEGTESWQQHFVYFLGKAMHEYSPSFASALVENRLYQRTRKCWLTRNSDFQQSLLKLSVPTFVESADFKRRFAREGGLVWFIRLLEYSKLKQCLLKCVVRALDTYITDERGRASAEFVKLVYDSMGECGFLNLFCTDFSPNDCDLIDKFLTKLSELNQVMAEEEFPKM